MSAAKTKHGASPLDNGGGSRWGSALIGSALVHVAGLMVWVLAFAPTVPEPTPRRVIQAVVLTPTRSQAPTPAPTPEPVPELDDTEPQPEPEPTEVPEALASPGPPPPPAACRGCAMMPSSLGVPKQTAGDRGKATIPWGVPGGVPGGVVGGVPGGVVGGVVGGQLGTNAKLPPAPSPSQTKAPKPLDVVMARALYTPHPDPKLLAKTKTGMFARHDGVNRTAFCIDEHGRTVKLRTAKPFGGDPQIDAICLDAVKQWRFKPLIVGGRAMQVCSVAVFEIRFE